MPKFRLSQAEAAYLGEMYRLIEGGQPPTVTALAARFRVRPPSVVEVLDRLSGKGVLVRRPWKAPQLTRSGRALATEIIHNHRVIELYFSRALRLQSDLSCNEAAKVDYLLSDEVVGRMCRYLHRPNRCVHGNPVEHIGCVR